MVERYANKAGKKFNQIQEDSIETLQAYDWPGNIRELQNVIERAVILCEGETFSVEETWLKRANRPIVCDRSPACRPRLPTGKEK